MSDDRISELYRGKIWSKALQQSTRRRINWLCSRAVGDSVLDVGCSQGIASILLGREGFHVTGIDIEPSRIGYALADLEREPIEVREHVRFEAANESIFGFRDGSFDTVLLGDVIEHLAVPGRLLAEVRRVLKPGGRVVITTPFGRSSHHDNTQTFYPGGVLAEISEAFAPLSIAIVDRHFRIVAEKAGPDRSSPGLDSASVLEVIDGMFEELDERRAHDQDELADLREQVATSSRELARKGHGLADRERGIDSEQEFRHPEVAHRARRAVEPSRDLLVATLLDEFSYDLFEHEFRAVQVTPNGWKGVLAGRPEMLLVESARGGGDDSWVGQIGGEHGPSDEFRAMIATFSEAGVPTVFWNNEDPSNYHLYIEAAKLFDVVFTVCEETIPDYLRDLGHDRVSLLPFSVQPKIHSPTAIGKRINGVAFAGTYDAKKHPDRVSQVEAVVDPARKFPFTIFSRHAPKGDDKWPDRFEPFIAGSLPYTDLLAAYKMFDVFLNVNSVVDSESTCSRRIFELAASGTPILSGTSPAIDRFFGDIVLQAGNSESGQIALRALFGSEEMRSRIAVRGIRTAMREHTASLRFDDILDRSGVTASRTPSAPAVSLVAPTNRPQLLGTILENTGRQSYSNLQLVIVAHGFDPDEADLRRQGSDLGVDNIEFASVDADRTLGEVVNVGIGAADGAYIGKMDDDDFYGAEFVSDLMDAFNYADTDIVGKWSYYAYLEGLDAMVLRFPGFEHSYVNLVAGATMIVERSVFDAVQFPAIPAGSDTGFLRAAKELGVRIYAGNRYNFVYMRSSGARQHTYVISDIELAAKGELVQYGLNLAHVVV